MKEQFEQSISVSGHPGLVWSRIVDVDRVASWVSIIGSAKEIEHLSRYRALLEDRLGPFRMRADLDITIDAVQPERLLRARAVGEDRQVGSRLAVEVELMLTRQNEGSVITVRGHYELTGRPATLGASSIRKKADKILEEFFHSAQEDLASVTRHES
jgi:carbon monoxide dehydrogenase subunit G